MRKTIMLGTLIALFGIGALAQAKDVTATDKDDAIQATQTTSTETRGDRDGARERHAESREQHRETRDGRRERHDEARKGHDKSRESHDKNRQTHDESREQGRHR